MLRSWSFAVVSLLVVSGCAAQGAEEELTQDSAELTESPCGARYGEALGHYQKAVAYSRERLEHGVCESDNGTLWNIANEASQAVMTCDAFRKTIRTSPWAAPLREALAPSLNLRSVSGELLVLRDSSWQNWTGVESLLPGTSFWAQAEGVYGSRVRVDFHENGAATWGWLDATGDDIQWRTAPATFLVDNPSGNASGRRTVRVTHDGITETFALNVQNPAAGSSAPLFVLVPADFTDAPSLYSLPSECDA